MEIAFSISFFLWAALAAWMVYSHRQTVENLAKRFDARERELLDRLMYTTNKPWNLPERKAEEQREEEPPDLEWRDF